MAEGGIPGRFPPVRRSAAYMRTHSINRPVGNDAETSFHSRQYDRAQTELQFFDSTTVKVEQTTRGIRLHAKLPPIRVTVARWQTPFKELDPTVPVAKGLWVYISPQNDLVTTGQIDSVSGDLAKAIPGIWEAARGVPPIHDGGYNVPQLPLPDATGTPAGTPLKGDFDGDNVYWLPIAPAAICY